MKRIFMIIMVLVLILALAGSAAAYTYTTYNMNAECTELFRIVDGVYLIGYGGYEVKIERLAPNPRGATLNLRYSVDSVGVYDDTVVALCRDTANRQLICYTYDIDGDILDSFAISGVEFTRGFCFDGSGIWMIDETNGSVMNRYSRSGRMSGSYTFPNRLSYLFAGDGCGYAVCAGTLYRFCGDSVTMLSGSRVSTPVCYIGNGLFSDVEGCIYELSGNSLKLLYTLESGMECASACFDGEYVYYPVDNMIYRYEFSTGVKRGYLEMNDTVTAMYSDGGDICAVTSGGYVINRIAPSEFNMIQTAPQNQNRSENTLISSDVYQVDFESYRITGISSPTTFAQFKSRIHYDGYTVRLYRGENEVKSGNVGTAMRIVFSNEKRSYTFELGITGDLTGEGNVNSRDISDMMGYLLGTVSFNGVYIDAADLRQDGRIDVADLALLCRMVG